MKLSNSMAQVGLHVFKLHKICVSYTITVCASRRKLVKREFYLYKTILKPTGNTIKKIPRIEVIKPKYTHKFWGN